MYPQNVIERLVDTAEVKLSREDISEYGPHHLLLATNVSTPQFTEFIETNSGVRERLVHERHFFLRNGNLLLSKQQFMPSAVHSNIRGMLYYLVKKNRDDAAALFGASLVPYTRIGMSGIGNNNYGYVDTCITTRARMASPISASVVVEVTFSTLLAADLERILAYMTDPEISVGYIFAVKYPWESTVVAESGLRNYVVDKSKAICITVAREGVNREPIVTDVISFGTTSLTIDDLEEIEAIINHQFPDLQFNGAEQIRGNVANRDHLPRCDAANLPNYIIHIPARMFLVNQWIDTNTNEPIAQAILDTIDTNTEGASLKLDLYEFQESIQEGIEAMIADVYHGLESIPNESPRW